MLEFKTPSLADKAWVDACLAHANSMNCEYTFGNAFIWAKAYRTEICKYKDFFICRWRMGDGVSYSLPLGEGDFTDAVQQIIADAKHIGCPPVIYGITQGYLLMLQEAFTGCFSYESDDGFSDYIYATEKMATLRGKKYHGKRNHITNFEKHYPDWQFERIDASNIDACIALHQRWLAEKDDADNEDYRDELDAVMTSFENYEALGFVGGLIRAGGEVVAYTFGEPQMNGKCFVSHFEKALSEVQGAYAIINREFTRHCLTDYEYVNREEDLGLEGLRKSKQSYHPEILLEKYVAVYHDSDN